MNNTKITVNGAVEVTAINPAHYRSHPSGVEVIEIVEHMDFCVGNAFKYVARAGLKGDVSEDLNKADWYIRRALLSDRPGYIWHDAYDKLMLYVDAEPDHDVRDTLWNLGSHSFRYDDDNELSNLTSAAFALDQLIKKVVG